MNVLELSEQEILRRQSLDELRKMGINPYPAAEFPTNAFSTEIRDSFHDDAEPREVCIAGRMMSRRVMGKASFVELQDSKGRIQVYITRDDLCPDENKDLYNVVFKKLMDIGDFIGVKGFVFRTQTGEISVHCKELSLLSKALKPLPIVKYKDGVAYDKFDDPELRYRQRYVDLVVNEGVKDTFLQRATVIRTLRKVLDEAGYTEVETPTLQMIARIIFICRPKEGIFSATHKLAIFAIPTASRHSIESKTVSRNRRKRIFLPPLHGLHARTNIKSRTIHFKTIVQFGPIDKRRDMPTLRANSMVSMETHTFGDKLRVQVQRSSPRIQRTILRATVLGILQAPHVAL